MDTLKPGWVREAIEGAKSLKVAKIRQNKRLTHFTLLHSRRCVCEGKGKTLPVDASPGLN